MQCNFSSLPWDWDCHQNPGKQIWILHVADLCQDRFGWVMLRYFLLFPLIFMWDDFCLESHNITNFVLIKKGSSWKTDHDRNGSDTFHYQLDDRGKKHHNKGTLKARSPLSPIEWKLDHSCFKASDSGSNQHIPEMCFFTWKCLKHPSKHTVRNCIKLLPPSSGNCDLHRHFLNIPHFVVFLTCRYFQSLHVLVPGDLIWLHLHTSLILISREDQTWSYYACCLFKSSSC